MNDAKQSESVEVESVFDRYAMEHPHGNWHVAARRTLWQRIKRPASYWPTRYTREVPLWHPWHIGAALVRLRFRWLAWRGY